MYANRYPPSNDTTRSPSKYRLTPRMIRRAKILSRETVINFWRGLGRNTHKRRWGLENLATTSTQWLSGAYYGDKIEFSAFCEGIIPLRTPFDPNASITTGSENWAVTALANFEGQTESYRVYLTSNPMPQVAVDVVLVVRVNGRLQVKILRRGNNELTVDNPSTFMSGAGEHVETFSGSVGLKEQAFDALQQETGISKEDFDRAEIYVIGKYNSPGRDPRYWTYNAIDEETGEPIEFGYERDSSTTLMLVFIDSDTGNEPTKTEPSDKVEVADSFWMPLDKAIELDALEFFIPENHTYLKCVYDFLTRGEIPSSSASCV